MKSVFTLGAGVLLLALVMNKAIAQTNTFPTTGAAGIGTLTPNASSLLDITSTTKGILIPRMTLTQRNAIVTPAAGLMIYQTNSTPGFYYYSGTAWTAVSPKAKGWSLTGNAGTDSTINFIGTTDAKPLVFRVNNVRAGFIGYGKSNTSFGYNALISNSTGNYNTANGTGSLLANTTGFNNAAYGSYALTANNAGSSNAAFGSDALHNNTSGSGNTTSGTASLYSNTTGYSNIALGVRALFSNTTSSNLVAIGDSALYYNGTGAVGVYAAISNTAVGSKALYSNTTGSYNTANGASALNFNTTGGANTANGFEALYSNTTGAENTANGASALHNNTTGEKNTANGNESLFYNTTGSYNTANGALALYYNTTGINNTANGVWALLSNTTGYENTANGAYTLQLNTTGRGNTANGGEALYYNTTGTNNTANGVSALLSNTTGIYNTANGASALYSNTTGDHNTANGASALNFNTTGYQNTANGASALYSNTIGIYNTANGASALNFNTTGYQNTANGASALYSNTTGIYNTANGFEALFSNTKGGANTANGYYALANNTTGNYNTGVGYKALDSNATGSLNTALGSYADVVGNNTNSTAIGYGGYVNTSNVVEIGNSSVTNIGGPVGWTVYSDGRFKKNIQPNVPGLSFITQLKPVTYTFDVKGFNKFSGADERMRQSDTGQSKNTAALLNAVKEKAINEKEKIVYTGLVAQDVEQAANKIGYNFSGVHKPQNDKDHYGLDYGSFVVPLIKAVQELSGQNDSLKQNNQNLISKVEALQEKVNQLSTIVLSIQQKQDACSPCSPLGAAPQTYNTTITDGAALEQNVPNPFAHTTSIGYTLPQKFTNAQIMITDKSGKTLKLVSVSGSGKGSLQVDASTLASGAYNYSLYVDGKLVGTKQMILAK